MRSKLLASVGLTVAGLAVAGCGGSSTSSASSGTGTAAKRAHAPIRLYHLTLAGAAETPRGAPRGSGEAVIALHGTTKICWRFSHLRGFTSATFAHIHIGPKGKSGNVVVPLSTGPKLHHKGCVAASPTVVKAVEKDPPAYYVNIHSTRYPGGAVRAQL